MRLKFYVLISSIAGITFFVMARNSVSLGLCESTSYDCRSAFDFVEHVLYIFPLILLFSLVTYWSRESIFLAWWKFARVAIPSVLLFSVILGIGWHHSPGGWFNIDQEIDLLLLFSVYSIFVIGSVVQIYREYRTTKASPL
jgi:hypothetical protein